MRLIDADALKAKIRKAEKEFRRCKIEPVGYKMTFADGVGTVADLIVDEAPTVEERQHGHWIGKPIAGYGTVRCSVCKSKFTNNTGRWNYCPSCGATMDEVVKK